MPDMDGLEVARRLRRKEHIDVPILIVSAYDWTDVEDEFVGAGRDDYVKMF